MKKIIMMVGAMLLTIGFTACGSDDDDNNNAVTENQGGTGGNQDGTSTEIPSPYLTDTNGNKIQVASIGGLQFTYNENGKLTGIISDYYGKYEMGETFTLTNYRSGSSYTRKTESAFTTNDKGLIVKSEYKYGRVVDSNWDVRETETRNYNYNSENQLTSITYTRTYIEESESGTRTGTVSFNWVDGNLSSIIDTSTDSYTQNTGEQKVENDKDTYTFEYGNQVNVFKQVPAIVCEAAIDINDIEMLGVLGLIGVGPTYLPTNCTHTDKDGRQYTIPPLTYELNENGSIKKEGYTEYQYK